LPSSSYDIYKVIPSRRFVTALLDPLCTAQISEQVLGWVLASLGQRFVVNEKSKRGRKLYTQPRILHTNASKHATAILKATFSSAVQASFEYLCYAAELQP